MTHAPAPHITPLAPLSRLLRTLLKINIWLTVIAVLAGIYGWIEYANLPPETDFDEAFLPSDAVNLGVGLLQIVVLLVVSVTFLRWIYRVNRNLSLSSSEPMAFTPGWAVGWYFIPVFNLWKPYQAMKEIWRVAHRGAFAESPILGWWWLLWLVSSLLGRLAARIALKADDAHVLSAVTYVFSDSVDVFLNVVALLLVTRIAAAYEANFPEQPATVSRPTMA